MLFGTEQGLKENQPEIKQLLTAHGLRVTHVRKTVLSIFCAQNTALSQNDILSALPGYIDRVTFYRTLQGFEENGIIHKVVDDLGAVRYALCRHEHRHPKNDDRPEDRHLHFGCLQCGRTLCLENVELPPLNLPKGFRMSQASFFVKGWCEDCNTGRR